MVWSGCPAASFIVAMTLARAPLLLLLLRGAVCFTGVVGGDGTVVGITVVFSLCRFCLVPAGFYKVLVRSYCIAAGSGRQRREP
jgi:hypothetical protein